MGTDLEPLIEPYKRIVNDVNFKYKIISIDAFNQIYTFLSSIKIGDKPLMAPHGPYAGHVTSHLQGLLNRVAFYLENDIRPVYVFDGQPNELKKEELQKRKLAKQEADFKARSNDEIEPVEKNYVKPKISADIISSAKKLLELFGIPYIDAPSDGEAFGAQLVKDNKAFALSSQDYDALLFGANRVVRNLTQTKTRKKGSVTVSVDTEFYSLQNILDGLKISHEQLITIGILVGTDFVEKVPGVGPSRALEIVTKYKTLDEINVHRNEIIINGKPIALDYERAIKAYKIFTTVPVSTMDVKFKKPKYDEIIMFLKMYAFNEDRVISALKKLRSKSTSKRQTLLTNFSTKINED